MNFMQSLKFIKKFYKPLLLTRCKSQVSTYWKFYKVRIFKILNRLPDSLNENGKVLTTFK